MDVREYLEREGVSMRGAAFASKVHVSTLSRIFSGQQEPRPLTVLKIARGLGVPPTRMQQMITAARQEAEAARADTSTSEAA